MNAARRNTGELDGDDDGMGVRCSHHAETLKDHEHRLRKLEDSWRRAIGAASALAALASFGGAIAARILIP